MCFAWQVHVSWNECDRSTGPKNSIVDVFCPPYITTIPLLYHQYIYIYYIYICIYPLVNSIPMNSPLYSSYSITMNSWKFTLQAVLDVTSMSQPRCSMYGIFTYITGWFLGVDVGIHIGYMEHVGNSWLSPSFPQELFHRCFRSRPLDVPGPRSTRSFSTP